MSIVWNAHPERGISEIDFLDLGIRYLKQQKDYEEYAGCCFMVCDQPLLQKESMQEALKAFIQIRKVSICVQQRKEREIP